MMNLEARTISTEPLDADALCSPGLMTTVGFGFLPAFRDRETGETHLSTNTDGSISPIHVLDGVPWHWIAEIDEMGRAIELTPTVVPGFVREGRFFELAELLHFPPIDA